MEKSIFKEEEDQSRIVLKKLNKFRAHFQGDLFTDEAMRTLYSTDASLYQMMPLAVAYPKSETDLQNLILFSKTNKTSLIPRSAGTSLGGQCVGKGIVVDVSRYMTEILEVNHEEKWVRVQPGVIRDELNNEMHKINLHFGPNTSTSNRAMIGGMVGNNSSGSFSIRYGTTRENVISIKGFLSDGSLVEFSDLDIDGFRAKSHGTALENALYRQISFELSHPITQKEIDNEFPKKSIHRRNTGYAVDQLLNTNVFHRGDEFFNFSKMLCGSEGTLMLFSEIKLKLVDKPTDRKALICAHFDSLEKSLLGAVEAMKLAPNQCELMDKLILDCTKDNLVQNKNRFFISGDPEAILMIEVEEIPEYTLEEQIQKMIAVLDNKNLTYTTATLYGEEMNRAMALRAAGLGVLKNLKGDDSAIEFVEDTAVAIEDLPEYIREFNEMILAHDTTSVFYAHAGAGELHTRPRVNLSSEEGRKKFRSIAKASASLVKKYQGSLSGEHGDGIVRAEFIPLVLGARNYELLKRIKQTWDPHHIFNPGKIVEAYKMDENLREVYTNPVENFSTKMDFSREGSFLKAAEKCSGSGDCRKTEMIGGTLCPSYHATREEKNSTRARANLLRDYITRKGSIATFESEEVYDILKLCLSCKACESECPSSVDIAAMKSEFLYQYHKSHQLSKIEKSTANFFRISKLISPFSVATNFFQTIPLISHGIKYFSGIDQRRSLPKYSITSFERWYAKNKNKYTSNSTTSKEVIYLYIDEFSNFLDAHIAKTAFLLLHALGIEVRVLPFMDSSRSLISKGFLDEARENINQFIQSISYIENDTIPLVGIEPSAILGIRDDYERLIDESQRHTLKTISAKTFLIEEYIAQLFDRHPQLQARFSSEHQEIIYHGHCHQKSLSSSEYAVRILSFPKNFEVEEIASGCCGMAGSFGYEHYDISMKIGSLKLFPTINENKKKRIAASGTSCRHQIKDGVQRKSFHPVEILYQALIK